MQLFHSAENIVNSEIFNNRTVEKIAQFIYQIKKWKLLKNEKKPMDILDQVLEESTYYEMWENMERDEGTKLTNKSIMFWAKTWGDKDKFNEIVNKEIIEDLIKNNKKAIFISGHFANYELMSMELTKLN